MSLRLLAPPILFLVGAVFGFLAAFGSIGFYGGVLAFVCIAVGVAALPRTRSQFGRR